MKITLFDKTIMPYCTYCEYFTQGTDSASSVCAKLGTLVELDACKHYIYAPLKRIPSSFAPLPKYSQSDFSID